LQSFANTGSSNAEAATNADAAALLTFAGQAAAAILATGPTTTSAAGVAGAQAAGAPPASGSTNSSSPSCTPVLDATINVMAGFSDVGTLGIAPTIRWFVGYDPGINRSSPWYWGGAAAPVVIATAGAATLPTGLGAAGTGTAAVGVPAATAAPVVAAEVVATDIYLGTGGSAAFGRLVGWLVGGLELAMHLRELGRLHSWNFKRWE
jgi:hypothetical protein